MNRYICSYRMEFKSPLDDKRVILLIRALSEDEALRIAMNKVKESDKDGWNINEVVEIENQPIEAVITVELDYV